MSPREIWEEKKFPKIVSYWILYRRVHFQLIHLFSHYTILYAFMHYTHYTIVCKIIQLFLNFNHAFPSNDLKQNSTFPQFHSFHSTVFSYCISPDFIWKNTNWELAKLDFGLWSATDLVLTTQFCGLQVLLLLECIFRLHGNGGKNNTLHLYNNGKF